MKLFKCLIVASITSSLIIGYYPREVKAQNFGVKNRKQALNYWTDEFFNSLNPKINGKIKSNQTLYKREWLAINQVVNNNLELTAGCSGSYIDPYSYPDSYYFLNPSSEDLTDAVFHARHSELNGRTIRKEETFLINEWKSIYTKISVVFPPDNC